MKTQHPSALSFLDERSNPFSHAPSPESPFAPPSRDVPADAPEGSYTYQLVQRGPAVSAEECEIAVAAIEVMVRWGAAVLHVAHLTPVRSFWVGEDCGKGHKSDLFLPAELLGARRVPLVLAGEGGVRLVIPAGATGSITLPGAAAKSVSDLLASGEAEPCADVAGAHQIALPPSARAELQVNALSFEISTVNAGRSTGRLKLEGTSLPYQGLSLLLHASLLAATALFVPSMAMAGDEGISDEQRYEMMALIAPEATREPPRLDEQAAGANSAGGDASEANKGPRGTGSEASRANDGRSAARGDRPEPRSREEAFQQMQQEGMISLIAGMNSAMGTVPSPWGRELPSSDPLSAGGGMFAQTFDGEIGGGLDLTGIGEVGGRDGAGVRMGRIGTAGRDFGDGVGRPGPGVRGGYQAKAPVLVRFAPTTVSGRLPPEIVQRVVRQNFGRFKACYESGLRENPGLQGRVAVRFVIGHEGEVSSVANGGSDLPDQGVVSCVTRAFYGLSFPPPDSGIVTVTYPIVFSGGN